jgi:sulfatase maturation enzyme AslB (radical SAM superfamily)
MQLSIFTYVLTEACNFRCSYCYKKRGMDSIDLSTAIKAFDFFAPFFAAECQINFYGGEPLLAFSQIKKVVRHVEEKNKRLGKQIRFCISTNGSLIDYKVLEFLSRHRFSLLLSFDGLAQEISRKKGSFKEIVSALEKLLKKPDIELLTNSVFTVKTVNYLSDSIKFIAKLGVPKISFSLSSLPPWNRSSLLELKKEFALLRKFILSSYEKTQPLPLIDFRRDTEKGIFGCFAGRDRMTLTPDGRLWGCHLFPDYCGGKAGTREYRKYCFGSLDRFIKNHKTIYPEVLSNYSCLQMDYFRTPRMFCHLCPELEDCSVCPVDAAIAGSVMGRIPDWICRQNKIFRQEKSLLWKEWEGDN